MCTDNAAMIAAAGLYRLRARRPERPARSRPIPTGRWPTCRERALDPLRRHRLRPRAPSSSSARWFDEASVEMAEREAVALVTVDTRRATRARAWCCCATWTSDSFGWYTNYESRKGRELARQPPRGAAVVLRARSVARSASRATSTTMSSRRVRRLLRRAPAWPPDSARTPAPRARPLASREALERRVDEVERELRGPRRAPAGALGRLPTHPGRSSSSGSTAMTGSTTGSSTRPTARAWRAERHSP